MDSYKLTQPREHFKQRNNKIASTVPIAGNDVDNPITVQPQQQPPQQSKKSLVVSTLSTNTNNIDIVQIQPPTGEIGGEPFNFNEKDEEEQQKEEEEEITKEQQNGEKEDKIEQDDQRNEEKINEGQKEEAEEIQKEPQEETTTKTTTNRFKRFAKQSSAACIIQ
uniref:Uncharacterized protein n=1 Tax=Meloidogyne hapla TaxID=6305 RepID=A0A1I8BKB8_MELHA